jgi:hypothetical protein
MIGDGDCGEIGMKIGTEGEVLHAQLLPVRTLKRMMKR